MLICFVCDVQNYKETCSNITYNCSTDTVAATCGNEASGSNFSSLIAASECSETIMNINGILKCQPQPAPSPSSSSTCGITFLYESELDQSGLYAPDGVSSLQCNAIMNCRKERLICIHIYTRHIVFVQHVQHIHPVICTCYNTWYMV